MNVPSSGEKPATDCRANEILALSLEEAAFMVRGGTKLMTISQPKSYDREDAPYPIGYELDTETGKTKLLFERGRECEPLPAGLGRYLLMSDCGYLETDERGWEHCGAYDERPDVCRDFVAGSDRCFVMQEVQVQVRLLDD